jgi:hypothetical protein
MSRDSKSVSKIVLNTEMFEESHEKTETEKSLSQIDY